MIRSIKTFLLVVLGLAATTIETGRAQADFIDRTVTFHFSGKVTSVDSVTRNIYTGEFVDLMPDVSGGNRIVGSGSVDGTFDTVRGEFAYGSGAGTVSISVPGSSLGFTTLVDLQDGSTPEHITLLLTYPEVTPAHSAYDPAIESSDHLRSLYVILTPHGGNLSMTLSHPSFQAPIDSLGVSATLKSVSFVPEPSSFVLLGVGLAGCGLLAAVKASGRGKKRGRDDFSTSEPA